MPSWTHDDCSVTWNLLEHSIPPSPPRDTHSPLTSIGLSFCVTTPSSVPLEHNGLVLPWLWHTPILWHTPLSGWLHSYSPASNTIKADFKGGGVEEIYLSYSQFCPLNWPFSLVSLFSWTLEVVWDIPSFLGKTWISLMGGKGHASHGEHHQGFYGLSLQVECGVIIFLWLFVDIIVSSLLRNLCSENNYFWINCFDNLLILLSTLFAFKLSFLLANLMCLLQ